MRGIGEFFVALCEAAIVRALWGANLSSDIHIERVWCEPTGDVHLSWSQP